MGASVTKMQQRWELYRLLSDPTRLRLLALASTEELAVSELAELVRQGQPKVSRHATALREAALLSARKQGTWVLLRLTPNAADDPVVADALATDPEIEPLLLGLSAKQRTVTLPGLDGEHVVRTVQAR